MLYLVSGTSRSGKTTIAKNLLRRKQLPYLSLDWLVMGFTNGIPQYGLHDKLWPNEIAERLWSFFEAMTDNMLWEDVDYVIEGEALLPGSAAKLIGKHPGRVRAVFVGYTDIGVKEKVALVKQYSDGENDWLTREPDAFIEDHISNMIQYSRMIRADCRKHRLPYFDTSRNFSDAIEKAMASLLGETS
jgi:hypothetical protein